MRIAAQTIQNGIRPSDHVGRWKDNELLAILLEWSENEVSIVGERIRKLVHGYKISWWGGTLHVTVSLGATGVHSNDSVERNAARNALRSQDFAGSC